MSWMIVSLPRDASIRCLSQPHFIWPHHKPQIMSHCLSQNLLSVHLWSCAFVSCLQSWFQKSSGCISVGRTLCLVGRTLSLVGCALSLVGRALSSACYTLLSIERALVGCPCHADSPSRSNCSTGLISGALFVRSSHQIRSTKLVLGTLFVSAKSCHRTRLCLTQTHSSPLSLRN